MISNMEIIEKYQKELRLISQVSSLLGWDQKTYMPKEGSKSRAEQLAFLANSEYKKITSEELFNALKKIKLENLSFEEKKMIEKLSKEIERSRKLPKGFVEELVRTQSLSMNKWTEAKKKSDFSIFLPSLKKVIELKRKQAKYINLPGHIYNSLLDEYEEGMTVEKLKPMFDELKSGLMFILKKIESSEEYKKKKITLLRKNFSKRIQMKLAKDVVKRMGIHKDFSRIDFSMHPFSTKIGNGDIRITTKIEKGISSFHAVMHEAGHSLYFRGIPEKYQYNILGKSPSFGMDESLALFWENNIGLGKSFWKFYFPKFNRKYKLNTHFDNWYKEVNNINPGMIRINADEIHYCLHIILRFELELALIEGSLDPKDLPKVWNTKMKELLGVTPRNDSEGVLQDMHWGDGDFGYFPSYAIGAIYASQLYYRLKKEIPDIGDKIKKGDLSEIREWLNKKIHKHGDLFVAEDLIKKVCGEGLNVKVFLDYLNNKYREIYNYF